MSSSSSSILGHISTYRNPAADASSHRAKAALAEAAYIVMVPYAIVEAAISQVIKVIANCLSIDNAKYQKIQAWAASSVNAALWAIHSVFINLFVKRICATEQEFATSVMKENLLPPPSDSDPILTAPVIPTIPTLDTLTHITDSITSVEQIPTLASINGISIDEIEKRARPAKRSLGPNQTVETEGMSYSGFLGLNESFKEVLLADWQTVQELGWTHKDLARHLGAICKAAQAAGSYGDEVELTYDYSGNGSATQDLKATYIKHRGKQEDIFDPSMDYSRGWNGQCLITNISTGASVMWSPGVETYIWKYGFYEGGGKQNKYRVDPVALISVLTGESEVSLHKKLQVIKDSAK